MSSSLVKWTYEREKLLQRIEELENEKKEWLKEKAEMVKRIESLNKQLKKSKPPPPPSKGKNNTHRDSAASASDEKSHLSVLNTVYEDTDNTAKEDFLGKVRNQRLSTTPRVRRPSMAELSEINSKLGNKKYQPPVAVAVGDDEDPNAGFLSSDDEEDESKLAVALYDYIPDAQHTNDLAFKKGDAIFVFSQETSGWWLGETHGETNARGMFPQNYVQLLETPKQKQLNGRYQLKQDSQYEALATRVFPDIRSTKVRDVPKDRIWAAYNRVLGKDNNVYLQLKKGDWVFMYDFDDNHVALRDRPLVKEVTRKSPKMVRRRKTNVQLRTKSPSKSPPPPPKKRSPSTNQSRPRGKSKQSSEIGLIPKKGMVVMVKKNAWYNKGRVVECKPLADSTKGFEIKVKFDVKALKPVKVRYPPKDIKSVILINDEKKRAGLKPREAMDALGMFTVEDPTAGMYMGWYPGVVQDVKLKGASRWRVVVKYVDGTKGASDHPASNLILLFSQTELSQAKEVANKSPKGKIALERIKTSTKSDETKAGQAGQTRYNLLKYFFKGDGLLELFDKATTEQIGHHFPMIMNAIALTPVWLYKEKSELIRKICQKINDSASLAQHYAYIMDSKSLMSPSIFTPHLKPSTQLPFWERVKKLSASRELVKDTVIEVPTDRVTVLHPLVASKPITKMKVIKVFESNTRPFLTQFFAGEQQLPVQVMIKFGDDFRQDVACMAMFHLMNFFWREDKRHYMTMPIVSKTYQCVAGGEKLGFIEFVEDCVCLYDSKSAISNLRQEQFHRLIASGAGSYIASYVLGIRDRHADNILIHKDGTLFHIDFGHVLGDTVTIDTHPFAITSGFKKQLGTKWNAFLDECIKAFLVLRRPENAYKLIQYAVVCFAPLYPEHKIVEFLSKQLYMSRDIGRAAMKIRKLIESAPNSYRTRVKNALHAVAVSMKG